MVVRHALLSNQHLLTAIDDKITTLHKGPSIKESFTAALSEQPKYRCADRSKKKDQRHTAEHT